ncbi:MAG: Tic20 family protein [Cyanobacteria bacterium P01_E01_bin.34]
MNEVMYRQQSPTQERLLSSLPYILPMVQALPLGGFLYGQFPFLALLVSPLVPLFPILEGNFAISLLVFFGLYFGVVRSHSLSRFIRFNTMQALLMGIGLSLLQMLVFQILTPILGGITIGIMASGLFLLTYGLAIYSFIWIAQGKYTDIPILSEAASSQVMY